MQKFMPTKTVFWNKAYKIRTKDEFLRQLALFTHLQLHKETFTFEFTNLQIDLPSQAIPVDPSPAWNVMKSHHILASGIREPNQGTCSSGWADSSSTEALATVV